MRRTVRTAYWLPFALLICCRGDDEARALEMCQKAEGLETSDRRASLELKRRLFEQMPTAGTVAAKECLRSVRERMGHVRLLVKQDDTGKAETVAGCAFALDVVEVFSDSINPPFRRPWTNRLLDLCVDVVGRAWTREPDNPRYIEMNRRLKDHIQSDRQE